jgi:CRISPR-associated protein Cas2
MLWVVCYDIAGDERRAAVCAALLNHGRRVQYSVFECHLTAYARERLEAELRLLLDPATDSLRFYPQCAWCASRRRTLGTALLTEDSGFLVY